MPRKRQLFPHHWSPYLERSRTSLDKVLDLDRLGWKGGWDLQDWKVNIALEDHIPAFLSRPHPLTAPGDGVELHPGLVIGEVSRHFDSKTTGSIHGWLQHNLGFSGVGVGLRVASFGLGVGTLGLRGSSTAQFDVDTTSRDDLVSDGFVAVFDAEDRGRVDTLRVIAPGEQAVREMVTAVIRSFGLEMGEDCWRDQALQGLSPAIANAFETEIPYVSDRLNAILRQPVERRSMVRVLGVPIHQRVLLGGAIAFNGDNQWHQLFPIRFLRDLVDEISRISSANGLPLRGSREIASGT